MILIWLSLAENGSVIFDDNLITYVPNTGFFGNDSFDYQIEDLKGGSDIGTVKVTVLKPKGRKPDRRFE